MICLYLAKSSSITLPDGSKVVPKVHETCAQAIPSGNNQGCSGYSMDPVYTGRFIADSNGQVKFGFENRRDGLQVKFSGITVSACGRAGEFFWLKRFLLVKSSMSGKRAV